MWRRRAVTLAASGAMILGLAACGGDGDGDGDDQSTTASEIPSDAVAIVGDAPVPRQWYDDNLAILLATGPEARALRPAYPDAERCAALMREKGIAVRDEGGDPITTQSALESHCRDTYDSMQGQAMRNVLLLAMGQQVAAERDVQLPRADEQDPTRGIDAAALRRVVRLSGVPEARFEELQRLVLLHGLVQENLAADHEQPADEQAQREYFSSHRDDFQTPETRSVRFLVAETESDAERARDALDRGAPWPRVVAQYATDGASREMKGRVVDIEAGTQEEATEEALSAAEPGQLTPPTEISNGWLVAEVVEVTPPRPQTFAQAQAAIAATLADASQSRLAAARSALEQEWRERTQCVPELAVPQCANGPDPAPEDPGTGSASAP